MNLQLQCKFTLKIIFISLAITTYSWALPTQCPSSASFTHEPGQSWQWNQSYTNWKINLGDSETNASQSQNLPSNSDLYVFISPNFQYVQCLYYYYNNLDLISITIESQSPLANVPPKLSSNFKRMLPADGPDLYTCQTQASTPEACAWSN